jgi:hypothetical protein
MRSRDTIATHARALALISADVATAHASVRMNVRLVRDSL